VFTVSAQHIADAWRNQETLKWQAQYTTIPPPFFAPDWDGVPAALGNARTDGNYSHATTGDGLIVWKKYRGYWVGGGASFTNAQHVRLSPARKALLVQVMAEDDYLAGIGTGAAVNLPAVQAFDVNAVMQEVAKFYNHPTRGLGIDLYWFVTPFTMPAESHTYTNGEFVANLYKHTGTNYYTASDGFADGEQAVMNSTIWVWWDARLRRENRDKFNAVFGVINVGAGLFVQKNRNDTELRDFIKIALPSRVGIRERDAPYRYVMDSRSNAANNRTSSILEARGAYVNVVNVSEELYMKTTNAIPANAFLDLMKFCITHELFHLIGGSDRNNNPGYVSGPPSPFGAIKAYQEELLEVNLPERFSILP